MNRALIGACLLLATIVGAAEFKAANWSARADIRVSPLTTPTLAVVDLPDAVFDRANADCSDLRVIDGKGIETGYVLERPASPVQQTYQALRSYNATYLPGMSARVTVDCGRRVAKTLLQVDTSGGSFRRRVQVEASDDGAHWQIVRENGMLYRIVDDGAVLFEKAEVSLPVNDQRYLRVTVFNGPGDPGTITIRTVRIPVRQSAPVPTKPVAVMQVVEKTRKSTSVVSAVTGYRHLPLTTLTLNCADATFFRRVVVYGRDAETETISEPVEDAPARLRTETVPWTLLGDGVIFRYPGDASLSIPVSGNASRYLRVDIDNGNDPPLQVTSMTATRGIRTLMYRAVPGMSYRLYLGNPKAAPPSYDLANYVDALRRQGTVAATLGPIAANPLAASSRPAAPSALERTRLLVWLAIIAVAAVLLSLIRRQLRLAKALEAAEQHPPEG
jgi:hypothetical protein